MDEVKAAMEQRLSCISLCVSDVARARRFYEAMGWRVSPVSRDSMPLFNANGFVFIVVDRRLAAEEAFGKPLPPEVEAVLANKPAFQAMLLSYVVREDHEVAEIIAHAVANGGRTLRPATEQVWGNLSGYFSDPEGFIWEVSRTRRTPLQPNGDFRIGG